MQLYQNPLLQPGLQAITSPGNAHNSASRAPLSPFPPHHERSTATNRDPGAPGGRSGFSSGCGILGKLPAYLSFSFFISETMKKLW